MGFSLPTYLISLLHQVEKRFHNGHQTTNHFIWKWVPLHYHPVVWGHLKPIIHSLIYWFYICGNIPKVKLPQQRHVTCCKLLMTDFAGPCEPYVRLSISFFNNLRGWFGFTYNVLVVGCYTCDCQAPSFQDFIIIVISRAGLVEFGTPYHILLL